LCEKELTEKEKELLELARSLIGEMTPEDRVKFLAKQWALLFGGFVKMLKEKYGEEGIKLACEVMRFLGRKYAEEKVKELNITPGKADVLDFYKIEGGWDPSMEYKFKLLELNKKKFHIYYTACPLVDIWKSIGAPEEICQIYAYFDVGVAEVLNPKMKVSNPTSLYKGDDHCDFIVELED